MIEEVEDALWRAAEALLPADALAAARLHAAVAERSRRYTSARDLLGEPLGGAVGAADLAARALFFGVADAGKVAVPLAELAARGLLPEHAPLEVLDLGAGAGAMTLGAAAYLAGAGRPVELAVTAIDRDREALAILSAAAGHLGAAVGGQIAVTARGEPLARTELGAGRFDLVLAGTVMNELGDEGARIDLTLRALAALRPDGALVVIEPALRETSRDLHRLRDAILARGAAHVFAPCTRTVAPCPALAAERDWCHEDRSFALPPRASRVAMATGLRDSGMKFSYLVLRRGAEPLVAAAAGRAALRVVSHPSKQKGRRECVACGEGGWVPLRLLTRNKGAVNRVFERSRRGDVVVLDDTGLGGERRDIGEDELVDLVALD